MAGSGLGSISWSWNRWVRVFRAVLLATDCEEGLAGRSIRGHAPAMELVTERLRSFLQYIDVKLIDDPSLMPAKPNAVERRPM